MSGIKFLLDTNIILGLLKSSPEVLTLLNQRRKAIELRRLRRVKLPDALIAATAFCHDLELLTLDQGLKAVASNHR
jgi:predicted nucleic acid-binding protein